MPLPCPPPTPGPAWGTGLLPRSPPCPPSRGQTPEQPAQVTYAWEIFLNMFDLVTYVIKNFLSKALTVHSGEKVTKWGVEFCVTTAQPTSVTTERRGVRSPAWHREGQRSM